MADKFTVLVDPKQQRAANKRTYEIMYRNWKELQATLEKHISDYRHWPKADRMANYQRLGPVFKVEPRALDEFTLQMEDNPNTLDPALVLTDTWAELYSFNPKETMWMIRDSMNITIAAERKEMERELLEEAERLALSEFGVRDPLDLEFEDEDTDEVEPEYLV